MNWSWRGESNSRSPVYETGALPSELRQHRNYPVDQTEPPGIRADHDLLAVPILGPHGAYAVVGTESHEGRALACILDYRVSAAASMPVPRMPAPGAGPPSPTSPPPCASCCSRQRLTPAEERYGGVCERHRSRSMPRRSARGGRRDRRRISRLRRPSPVRATPAAASRYPAAPD